jgi:two-component system, OmpR family, response regulator CpxR
MSVVSIFSGSFCSAEEVAHQVADRLGYPLLRDEDLIGRAVKEGGPQAEVLRRAMYGRTSIFNQFSHEKERAVIWLKLAMALLLENQDMVFLGYAALLPPDYISHVLEVCLIAETKHRAQKAAREQGLSPKEALARVHRDDEAAIRWVEYLRGREPWDPQLYDILLPIDKSSIEEVVQTICAHAEDRPLQPNEASKQAVNDFLVSTKLEKALAAEGHNPRDLAVEIHAGKASIMINKKVMRLSKLAEELEAHARSVSGVDEVKVDAGPDFYQADIYRHADFKLPSKVLLVDDEREFVQTLSERLMLREIGSAVVYDGEEALRLVAEDEPEVLVLDLKMPGIDGIEVLRRLKRDYPKVEVIILTGHGSESDKETCLQLGAFAYLEKPVDIERLSEVMQEAYDAVGKRQ